MESLFTPPAIEKRTMETKKSYLLDHCQRSKEDDLCVLYINIFPLFENYLEAKFRFSQGRKQKDEKIARWTPFRKGGHSCLVNYIFFIFKKGLVCAELIHKKERKKVERVDVVLHDGTRKNMKLYYGLMMASVFDQCGSDTLPFFLFLFSSSSDEFKCTRPFQMTDFRKEVPCSPHTSAVLTIVVERHNRDS